MKELVATNPASGMKIIERYIDGVKFMKVTPKRMLPLILEQLRKQVAGQGIEIQEGDKGWIKYHKLHTTDGLERANEKLREDLPEEDVDKEDYILKKEGEMLKSVGFIVEIREVL
jgi:hypothetical protein